MMTPKNLLFDVSNDNSGLRLDIFLSKRINDFSRTKLKTLIKEGFVKLNEIKLTDPSKKIKLNDKILIEFPLEKNKKISSSKMNLNIIYEDKDIIIINKQAGIVVHPGAGNHDNTLVNGLLYKYRKNLSSLGGAFRPGIVHRIDKDTSGIIVVAKNDIIHNGLAKQFSDHSIEREYEALVWGSLRPQNGKIVGKIARSKKNRQLMEVNFSKGKKAITNYKTLKIFQNKNIPKMSLVKCKLETGRTHQIRVHMSFKGNPLIGDRQYGKKIKGLKNIEPKIEKELTNFKRQALHAKNLGFIHPAKNKKVFFEAPRPRDFNNILKNLQKYSL